MNIVGLLEVTNDNYIQSNEKINKFITDSQKKKKK